MQWVAHVSIIISLVVSSALGGMYRLFTHNWVVQNNPTAADTSVQAQPQLQKSMHFYNPFLSTDGVSVYFQKFTQTQTYKQLVPATSTIVGADGASFRQIEKSHTMALPGLPRLTVTYYGDAHQVFAYVAIEATSTHVLAGSFSVVPGADPKTFLPISFSYAKDARHVYVLKRQLVGAYPGIQITPAVVGGSDLATFEAVTDQTGYDAKDASHRYLQGQIVKN